MRKIETQSWTKALKTAIALLAIVATAAACTKKRELKDEVGQNSGSNAWITKSEIDGKVYALAKTVQDADGNGGLPVVPGFMANLGLVRVKITETELQLIPIYNPKGGTEKKGAVISYPIKEHFDIERVKNEFGEDTHKVAKDKDVEKAWNERLYITVDWSKPSNSRAQISTMFLGEGVSEESTVLVEDVKIENGHITFVNESTLVTKVPWIEPTKVKMRTNLLPVPETDYEADPITAEDFNKFGYFYSQHDFEDQLKGVTDDTRKFLARKFNVCEAGRMIKGKPASCSTNQIVWVLTKDFPAKYAELAEKAVNEWNETYQEALGRTDTVVRLDKSKQVGVADAALGMNVIAYYDPQVDRRGLLGVGQAIENDKTGEILSGRATVYGSGIRIQMAAIDRMVDIMISDKEAEAALLASLGAEEKTESLLRTSEERRRFLKLDKMTTAKLGKTPVEVAKAAQRQLPSQGAAKLSQQAMTKLKRAPEHFMVADLETTLSELRRGNKNKPSFDDLNEARMETIKDLSVLNGVEKALFAPEIKKMNAEAKAHQSLFEVQHGIHNSELMDEATIRFVAKIVEKNRAQGKDLDAMRPAIKEEVANLVFYSTLLHEIGHVFGLRHNFAGSSDKEHFHPAYHELKKKLDAKDPSVHPADLATVSYSSVMDYGADFYLENGAGLGPYDKAAIKYGYNRSIDRENDEIVRANFRFCSDEVAGGDDVLCDRYDRGTNLSEVTLNRIQSYHRDYLLRNFRLGRSEFGSPERLRGRIGALASLMIPIRRVTDEFMFKLALDPGIIIKDKETGRLVRRHFVNASIVAGEYVDISKPEEVQKLGLDLSDLTTLPRGLFDAEGKRRVALEDMIPEGLADMVTASELATQFFMEVIGAPEPGLYLLEQNAQQALVLTRLIDMGSIEASLKALAEERKMEDPDKFAREAAGGVLRLNPGPVAKYYSSRSFFTGVESRTERIGFVYDKVAALIAMSVRDINVGKFNSTSFTGNLYSWPHTKPVATHIYGQLINGRSTISSLPIRLADGRVLRAALPASKDLSLETNALAAAMIFGVTPEERSLFHKLRICDATDEKNCMGSIGQQSAAFAGKDGVFRAAQTVEGDSIVFNLVAEAEQIETTVKEAVSTFENRASLQEKALKELEAAEPKRKALAEALAAVPETQPLADVLTKVDTEEPSAWMLTKFIVTLEVPEENEAQFIQMANSVMQLLQQTNVVIEENLQKLGDKSVCTTEECKANPEVAKRQKLLKAQEALVEVGNLLSSVIDLKVRIVQWKSIATEESKKLAPIESRLSLIRAVIKDLQ